jgi:hypothetical protein
MLSVQRMIKGTKLALLLETLKEQANEHHRDATKNWGSALEHARLAGKALQEAFERLGRRSKWGKWLRRNFEGSARLSRDYRRIWRERQSPLLADASANGLQLTSNKAVLKVLRGGATLRKKNGQESEATLNLQLARRTLQKDFLTKLTKLKPDELRGYPKSDLDVTY